MSDEIVEGIEECECGGWDEGECPNCNDSHPDTGEGIEECNCNAEGDEIDCPYCGSDSHTGPVEGKPPIDVNAEPMTEEIWRLLEDNIRLRTTIRNLLDSMDVMAAHTSNALELLQQGSQVLAELSE